MATERWVAGSGVGYTWTAAFTSSTLNSIASGNAILSDLQIDNTLAQDIFCDVCIQLGTATWTTTNGNFIGIYIYPFNQDASTYGDGRFTSSAAGPPPNNYNVGNIGINTGTTIIATGALLRVPLPSQRFKFLVWNQGGVAFNASGNNVYYRTYNRQVL